MPQRVLFVDDEVGVLQGLSRLLFEMDDWDMVFVDSGDKALDALRRARFDVIVSDMCMPGMDGAMLLSRVHAESPGVVRIILTGHSELEATFRAMPAAHSFLTRFSHEERAALILASVAGTVFNAAWQLEGVRRSTAMCACWHEADSLPLLEQILLSHAPHGPSPEPELEAGAASARSTAALA